MPCASHKHAALGLAAHSSVMHCSAHALVACDCDQAICKCYRVTIPGSWVDEGKVDVSDEGCADEVLAAIKKGKDCLHSCEVRLVIEHCDRGCLRTALDEELFLANTGLNYAAILDSASDIARAMLHLHCNDVVHADLKAQNVMLCSSGAEGRGVTCKIADFGLAVRMENTETHMSGLFQGTLTHMAPEILLEGRVSKAADVYAFGITCWELFTSGKPFHGVAKALLGHVIAREHCRPTFPNLTPEGFRRLIERCWAHNPEDRPPFHQIVEELKKLRRAVPGPTPPVNLHDDASVEPHVMKLGSSAVPYGQGSHDTTKSVLNPLAFANGFSPPESPHIAIDVGHGSSSFFEEVDEVASMLQGAGCTGGSEGVVADSAKAKNSRGGGGVRDAANKNWSPTNSNCSPTNNTQARQPAKSDWSPISNRSPTNNNRSPTNRTKACVHDAATSDWSPMDNSASQMQQAPENSARMQRAAEELEEAQRAEAARLAAVDAARDLAGGQPVLPFSSLREDMIGIGDGDKESSDGFNYVNSVIIIGDEEANMFGVKAQEQGANREIRPVLFPPRQNRSFGYSKPLLRCSLPAIGEDEEDGTISSREGHAMDPGEP
ncbi:kinase-like domain-containing protein [Dunaliella salina]|uniref:Kinase-like domain-containing protein n=1 Tax=Dunaliella salina TaxID=3046 RepID=A0ABQ7H3M5_DUNSA|nr:kinase-like domain-containing protein [Dunaliella salina]|eukprot:KAF5841396.1 kinase-like domain-containing protein [Dunaliella salina]